MTIKEANKIIQVWGVYLEYMHGKLSLLFMAHIPESFLPYPQDVLEEAINIMAKYYYNVGDIKNADLLKNSIGPLMMYKGDKEAIILSASIFNDKKWLDAIVPRFKAFQEKWIKNKEDFPEKF